MVIEPTISCNTEPKCVNPNSGKVVNTVLPAVIWNALSESDASWQTIKYYSILSHSLWNKYVLRKLLMFSLAFMWTKLNSLGFSVYFLYSNLLKKLCSSKDQIYKLAGMICQRFLCALCVWRIWGPYTESKNASEKLFGFQFSCIDFGCHFCIPETHILNVIMISAKIFQTCWITPQWWRWQRNMEKHLHKFCFVTLCNEA